MDAQSFLVNVALYLVAAVIAVPIFKRIGLGSVLGYLAAGAVIGPWGLGLITNVQDILHFAELGVVLLLFLIGLELEPARLWEMRRQLLGLGGAQVLASSVLLGLIAHSLGMPPGASLVIGFSLSLSSTAFVLQILGEKNELGSQHGQAGFSTLLFQDIAVIPFLALVPMFAPEAAEIAAEAGAAAQDAAQGIAEPGAEHAGAGRENGDHHGASEHGLLHGLDGWLAGLIAAATMAGVVGGGRWLLRPALRMIASARNAEVFTAAALLRVIGVALIMETVGLSMALGAFLAGVLLADSEYRHELEADIAPFKGLLLGLFFIAVGMSVDFGLLWREPLLVLGFASGLLALKAAVLFALGRINGLSSESSRNLALLLPQGGEFAFVLFGLGVQNRLLPDETARFLILVVTVSMAFTPLLVMFNERYLRPRLNRNLDAGEFDSEFEAPNRVILAGFGRFGQIVGRLLRSAGVPYTALEHSSVQVELARKFGNKLYYGDASRVDLLRTAGAETAELFVLAIDDPATSVRAAEAVRENFPHLKILARARNRTHAFDLMRLGVHVVKRETFDSSLNLGTEVLHELGIRASRAKRIATAFAEHDVELMHQQFGHLNDEERLISLTTRAAHELEKTLQADAEEESEPDARPAPRGKRKS